MEFQFVQITDFFFLKNTYALNHVDSQRNVQCYNNNLRRISHQTLVSYVWGKTLIETTV